MGDLNFVPYTKAFIKESLRLFTSIPITIRICNADTNFGKYQIPKGTGLLMPVFCLNKDESFDEAHKFNPERYLKESKLIHKL